MPLREAMIQLFVKSPPTIGAFVMVMRAQTVACGRTRSANGLSTGQPPMKHRSVAQRQEQVAPPERGRCEPCQLKQAEKVWGRTVSRFGPLGDAAPRTVQGTSAKIAVGNGADDQSMVALPIVAWGRNGVERPGPDIPSTPGSTQPIHPARRQARLRGFREIRQWLQSPVSTSAGLLPQSSLSRRREAR